MQLPWARYLLNAAAVVRVWLSKDFRTALFVGELPTFLHGYSELFSWDLDVAAAHMYPLSSAEAFSMSLQWAGAGSVLTVPMQQSGSAGSCIPARQANKCPSAQFHLL